MDSCGVPFGVCAGDAAFNAAQTPRKMIKTKEKFFVYMIRDDLKRVWVRTVGTEAIAQFWVDKTMKDSGRLAIYTKTEIKNSV